LVSNRTSCSVCQPHRLLIDRPAGLVGSLTRMHTGRVALLETLASALPLDVWAPSIDHLPRLRGFGGISRASLGLRQLSCPGPSAITVNMQIDTADDYADNIRLYESTGLGTLLITDVKRNLPDLFRAGQEVVAYTMPRTAYAS